MAHKSPVISPDQASGPLVLAIDIGTSAARTALFDRLGRAVEGAEARRAFSVHTSAEGASETDPDTLLERVWQCLDEVLRKISPPADQIVGVAACTFVGNILGVDEKGRAVTALMTYADTRSESEVAGLKTDFDEAAAHDRTGCHFHSSYLPARFRWFKRAQPDIFRKAARWMSIGEYMQLKLFGDAAVSYSVASWNGLLNRSRLAWDAALLEKLPVEAFQLSPLVDINTSRQGLKPEYAKRWPALQDIPWFPALGDGAAANVGSSCTTPYRVALTMGTTTAVRAIVDTPIDHIPEGLWCYRVDARRSLPGGALSEGGSLFAWMTNTLQLDKISNLESELGALNADAHGLTILPFLAGEQSPGWRGQARATIHGLSLATTPLAILRAGMEAVAYRVALVFDRLAKLLPANAKVIASGGALYNSPVWLQIMSDVLNRPVDISRVQEASARGAALLAFEALGLVKALEGVPDFIADTYHPDSERHALYQQAIERQKRLYDKLVKKGL